jgi:hypothetical protein
MTMMRRSPSRPQTAGPRWPALRAQAARPGHVVRARRVGAPALAFAIARRPSPLLPNVLDAAA